MRQLERPQGPSLEQCLRENDMEGLIIDGRWLLGLVVVVVVVGIISWWIGKKSEERKEFKVFKTEASTVRKYSRAKTLDPTKRKSLSPQNRTKMPEGWDDEAEKKWQKANFKVQTKASPKPLQPVKVKTNDYFHKFYGSQFSVDGIVLIGGLSKKMHKLEITTANQLYLDGSARAMNPTEVERIKQALDRVQ